VIRADARALPLAAGSVQCVVTSPPYWGLRDYGTTGQLGLEATPDAYVAGMVAVFRQVWRVLRDDGVLFLNLGDSYNSSPSNQQNGSMPRNSPDMACRAGAFHTQGRQKREIPGLKPKDLVGIPWRVAFALQADGWYLRSDIVWAKPNPMPESVTDRPTKSHEYVFLLTKAERYYWDADAVAENGVVPAGTLAAKGSAERFALPGVNSRPPEYKIYDGKRNLRSVWSIATQPYAGAHFATMPEALAERCILAGSRHGDLVLDPFLGSGTVARCAISLGRRGVGCDLNREYLRLADERTQVTMGLPLGFA